MRCGDDVLLSTIFQSVALKEEAKRLVSTGNREQAKTCLRRKQAIEKRLKAQSGILDNVAELLDRVHEVSSLFSSLPFFFLQIMRY